jgi:hypothetical protein
LSCAIDPALAGDRSAGGGLERRRNRRRTDALIGRASVLEGIRGANDRIESHVEVIGLPSIRSDQPEARISAATDTVGARPANRAFGPHSAISDSIAPATHVWFDLAARIRSRLNSRGQVRRCVAMHGFRAHYRQIGPPPNTAVDNVQRRSFGVALPREVRRSMISGPDHSTIGT